jgi:predicted metal-dependent HD superfamily phosphohydrolase
MDRAIYLSKKEWLNDEEIEILALAWLFHDTWFVIQYDRNEPFGAKIAENYLKSILYPNEKIKIIERLILATDPDYKKTKDIYDTIIKDADMDNLWRDDFIEKSHSLKKEIEIIKDIKIKDPDWNHWLVDLLKEHQYKAFTQKIERDSKKNENLKKMLEELEHSDEI